MRTIRVLAVALAATALSPISPAFADVKDGVDAWGRGDYAGAVKQWQGPAAKGDADALYNLAQAYKFGRGVPQDPAKAQAMYRQAAEKGHARAADNYGLMLFQGGHQADAMPWLASSAERGEPRAMYILGIAAFNGDFAAKDWPRAYALMTRAAGAGLPQAVEALSTMNAMIPLDQRQKGAALAQDLERKGAEMRGRELAAADLGTRLPATAAMPAAPLRPQVTPAPIQTVTLPPARTEDPATASTGPVMAGADYANPVAVPRMGTPAPKPTPKPAPKPVTKPALASSEVETPAPKPAATGSYRIQLGAFGQKSNADALWSRLRNRAELSGHARADVPGGAVTRLQATGFTQSTADKACASLKAAGETCLVVRP